ncbi:hypothetical protein DES39_1097 [Orbus hercynius]|uniref:Uncharacterized protein n=1 Tax=Orbus hercynius TaxID=593135 RepID=A0A495RKM5_9GAMM|nr:Trm112 family protein [Orbus hercynius]RKS87850.1 hypothetical protein DES39_1097 [Orbus hercynius]
MKQKLLDSIACPKCFGKLDYNEKKQKLICVTDGLEYSIVDGIAVLIESEAIELDMLTPEEAV